MMTIKVMSCDDLDLFQVPLQHGGLGLQGIRLLLHPVDSLLVLRPLLLNLDHLVVVKKNYGELAMKFSQMFVRRKGKMNGCGQNARRQITNRLNTK